MGKMVKHKISGLFRLLSRGLKNGRGGGGGSYSGGPQAFMDARPGTGGGGGAAWHPDTYRSGNGGGGIVIVRYRS